MTPRPERHLPANARQPVTAAPSQVGPSQCVISDSHPTSLRLCQEDGFVCIKLLAMTQSGKCYRAYPNSNRACSYVVPAVEIGCQGTVNTSPDISTFKKDEAEQSK